MDRSRGKDQINGTRAEIITELEERAAGWHHMASDRKRDRALEAAESVRKGAASVTVGNTVYSVSDALPDQRAARDETADKAV